MQSDYEPLSPRERTFTERARRAQLVAGAIETIANVGYAHASLARVAERSGTSKGVLTYHFKDKRDLVQAVWDEIIARGVEHVAPRVLAENGGRGALRAYIESNLGFMALYPDHMIALYEIFANARGPAGEPVYDSDTLDALVVPLEGLLRHYQESGELGDFDARSMAFAIRGAIDAVPARLARQRDLDLDRYAVELAAAFDRATRPVKPDEPGDAGRPGDLAGADPDNGYDN